MKTNNKSANNKVTPTDKPVEPANVPPVRQDVLRRISQSSILLYAYILIFTFVTVYYYSSVDIDYDVWYHLKFGEHFVKNKTFHLDHSVFSWTPADPEWKYGIWLGSLALYLMYSFAGVYGLEFIKWLVVVSVLLLYLYYSYRVEGKIDISNILVAFFLVVSLNIIATMIKPDNFTLVFFAVSVFVYFHTKVFSSRIFYVYPLLFLLWVNTHGGFLVGLFFITVIFFGELLNLLFKRQHAFTNRLMMEFALVVASSYLITLFNPYGIDYHLYLIPTFFKQEYMSYAAGKVLAFTNLWNFIFSDFLRLRNALWGLILLFAIFLSLSVYLFKNKRLLDIGLLFSNVLFFYLGTTVGRVAVFSAILLAFSIAYQISRAGAAHVKRKISAPCIVSFFLAVSFVFYSAITGLENRSWALKEDVLPEKEVEFIKKYRLPQPIFNDYLIGGYLIWSLYPDYKVFIDPRYGPYWKQVGPDYYNLLEGINADKLKAFHDKYPFKTAIIHYIEIRLILTFLSSDNWRLVYFGDTAAIFVHKDVFDELDKGAFSVDLSPNRFYKLQHPGVLRSLFSFYANLGLVKYAEEMKDLYAKNVYPYYRSKEDDMRHMDKILQIVRFNQRQK